MIAILCALAPRLAYLVAACVVWCLGGIWLPIVLVVALLCGLGCPAWPSLGPPKR